MKKNVFLLSILIIVMLCSNNVAWASDVKEINLNINGRKVEGQYPIVINNHILVPIRTVSLVPNVTVDWDNKNKTVTVKDSLTKDIVKLKVGSKTAFIGENKVTLETASVIKDGFTYVPFRFIGEGLKAYVEWDINTNSVIIYKIDNKLSESLKSIDIVEARNAAIKLPRIILHDGFSPTEEGGVGGNYYFKFGQKNTFLYLYRGIAQYYEVKNGAAWEMWEAQIGSNSVNINDVIPNIVPSIEKEWGSRPVFTGKINYFMDLWKIDQVTYGTIDETGKSIFEDSKQTSTGSKNIIYQIPGES